jgi:hypothetical protein
MREQIDAAIAPRNPLIWDFIRRRNIFGGPLPSHVLTSTTARHKTKAYDVVMSFLRR